MVWAKQTIVATGGAGQLYRETTNPEVATGDGMALAYRAGAELRDMEFMQFHPTVLYIAGGSRSLISEAVRGEGAWLVDRNGHRFMTDYDPRGELAPRDVVSLAIVSQMEKTRHPNVYLELNHLDPARVLGRFPGIAAVCASSIWTSRRDRIPVRPGAHYMMGGISVDLDGRTTLPGLWAAGEVIASGLHGANRLASNSLLEAMVYGAHAGEGASQAAAELHDDFTASLVENPRTDTLTEPLKLADIRNSLQSLMWRNMGVRREAEGLQEALASIDHWSRYVLPRQFADPTGWELQNMLCVVAADDRGGDPAQGNPRLARASRFPPDRRRPLETPHHVSPRGRRCDGEDLVPQGRTIVAQRFIAGFTDRPPLPLFCFLFVPEERSNLNPTNTVRRIRFHASSGRW